LFIVLFVFLNELMMMMSVLQ